MIRRKKAAKPTACPGCGSADLARIMYGLPVPSAALEKALERGKVALGGCCVTGHDPEWHCNSCHLDFHSPPPRRRLRKAGPGKARR